MLDTRISDQVTLNVTYKRPADGIQWNWNQGNYRTLNAHPFSAISSTYTHEKGPYIINGPSDGSIKSRRSRWGIFGKPATEQEAYALIQILSYAYNAGVEDERERIRSKLGL